MSEDLRESLLEPTKLLIENLNAVKEKLTINQIIALERLEYTIKNYEFELQQKRAAENE